MHCITYHMYTVHVLLDFDQLIMFIITTCHSGGLMYQIHDSSAVFMFTLIILTCLYDVPLQRNITPWHMTLNGHAPMSEPDSEV